MEDKQILAIDYAKRVRAMGVHNPAELYKHFKECFPNHIKLPPYIMINRIIAFDTYMNRDDSWRQARDIRSKEKEEAEVEMDKLFKNKKPKKVDKRTRAYKKVLKKAEEIKEKEKIETHNVKFEDGQDQHDSDNNEA